MKLIFKITLLVLVYKKCSAIPADQIKENDKRNVRDALDSFPVIDGHNDLPYNALVKLSNKINDFDFNRDLSDDSLFGKENCSSCHTDLVRIKKGKVGAQFWSAYIDCASEDDHHVANTMDQIDVIKRLINNYPDILVYATSAADIENAIVNKKLASLIGVEGGHSIENRLSVLRLYYELGVRYMTLTHNCNLDWADSNNVDKEGSSPIVNLSDFGKKIVLEMNRLGMLVDLAHVSHNVMSDTLDVSQAPVIFSHSSARAIYDHRRNVADDILKRIPKNRGIVMVNFYPGFIAGETATTEDVARHISHIVEVAGIDHVGIGADYDGVSQTSTGLEDVSKYPSLFALLQQQNATLWTDENLAKLAGKNLIRVLKEVEAYRDSVKDKKPDESILPKSKKSNASKITFSFLPTFLATFISLFLYKV